MFSAKQLVRVWIFSIVFGVWKFSISTWSWLWKMEIGKFPPGVAVGKFPFPLWGGYGKWKLENIQWVSVMQNVRFHSSVVVENRNWKK